MNKEELKYSIIQALRFEFDSQKVEKHRLIEIAKTVKQLDMIDEFREMVSDLKLDGIINEREEREML